MSMWTYIHGTITVTPMGRTQAETRYILDTVLDHLPRVSGSEKDMYVHVVQKAGWNSSCSDNEFGQWIPHKDRHTQSKYILVLEAALRDRAFDETKRELNNWLNRLAKRVGVSELLVRLYDCYDRELIISNAEPYAQMEEWPSWCKQSNGEPAWAEYLMWERHPRCDLPLMLVKKYYDDPKTDDEIERRKKYYET